MGEERSTKQASEGVAAGNISDEDWGRRPGVFNLRGIAALQPLQDIISGLPPGEIEFSSALPQHRDTTGISGVLELVGGRRAFPKFEEGFEMLERLWRWDDFWGNNTSGRNVSTSGVPDTTPQVPCPKPETRNPKTLNPKPETRNTKHETRNPKPEILDPRTQTRSPKPETRTSKPETRNPKLSTLNPKP
ncbi:hypothetical protein T484DRAFT_3647385 [Baffinella frigidus]|nr:hypothetical protein T484DRAFT_3647385 [Cryptophyta sp. CCMP2293]